MRLSLSDVAFHEQGSTDLQVIIPATENRDGQYETFSDCGYLEIDEVSGMGICTAINDPNRPNACTEFQIGSEACVYMRRGYGI